MQSASAPSSWRRWLQWGRVPLLGAILGALQFLLLTQATALAQWSGSSLPAIVIGLVLYLFISALAGFLAARRSEKAASGGGAGCLVGGIGFLVVATPLYLTIILAPPPTPCSNCTLGSAAIAAVGSGFVIGILFIEFWGGVLGGLLGGWMGGLLGKEAQP